MTDILEIKTQLTQFFKQLGTIQQRNKFLFSCMSEGLLPRGLQISFNLAKYVNNQNLVNQIQGVIDDSNSRLFDLVYEKSQEEEVFMIQTLSVFVFYPFILFTFK